MHKKNKDVHHKMTPNLNATHKCKLVYDAHLQNNNPQVSQFSLTSEACGDKTRSVQIGI